MSENKMQEASECFMCKQYKPMGCLGCRTHRLLEDIRHGLYEKMGVEQNRTEWEERALKAESQLTQATEKMGRMEKALENLVNAIENSSIETLNGKNSTEMPHDPERAFIYGAHVFFKLIGSSFPEAKEALSDIKNSGGKNP